MLNRGMATLDTSNPDNISALCKLAVEAGINAMRHYHDGVTVEHKQDNSPVTLADSQGEDIIIRGLKELCPDIQIIGEESFATANITNIKDCFFLLDPLDGTKEFIQKKTDFTVNIGLVQDGHPIAGVVFAPALEQLFFTRASKAYEMTIPATQDALNALDITTPTHITTRTPDADGLIVVASRSHRTPETDDYLKTLSIKKLVSVGSSLKFCLIAKGMADIYPRYGRTMEWDTAAAHAILCAAGGTVVDLQNKPLTYGKLERGLDNPYFIARA